MTGDTGNARSQELDIADAVLKRWGRQTHWSYHSDGCWRVHYQCAVKRLHTALTTEIGRVTAERDAAVDRINHIISNVQSSDRTLIARCCEVLGINDDETGAHTADTLALTAINWLVAERDAALVAARPWADGAGDGTWYAPVTRGPAHTCPLPLLEQVTAPVGSRWECGCGNTYVIAVGSERGEQWLEWRML